MIIELARAGARRDRRLGAGAVREDEDLPREAGLDDSVSTRGGQIVGAPWRGPGEPEGCAVWSCDDLHVHAVLLVLLGVVRLVRMDAVGGDQVRVGPGRPADVSVGGFPRAASRTRRARLHATGVPQVPVVSWFSHAVLGQGEGIFLPR